MRLTFHTDYALRMLLYLSVRPERLNTIQDVSAAFGISRNHLMKVAHELGRLGFVDTVRGRGGGLKLSRPPEEIRLGDVVRAMEEDLKVVECFDPDHNTCAITGICRLRGALSEGLMAWMAVLDRYTLADLAAPRIALSERLKIPLTPDVAE